MLGTIGKGGSERDPQTVGRRWLRTGRGVAWSAALLCVLLMAGRLWWLPAHASLRLNEGWNAGHVARAFGAGSLYPAPDALFANNYPPLSFFIVGLADELLGDAIVAGRLVALLSQAAVGWAVYVVVIRLARDPRWAVAGVLLFAALGATLLRSYLAIDDPQWLAQAVTAWALVLLLPRHAGERASGRDVLLAAVLTVAAGLIKHNVVAFPAAATVWLWIAGQRGCYLWVAAGVVLASAACTALFAIWGADVFVDVLAPARTYSAQRMIAHGTPLLLAVLPGALALWPMIAACRGDHRLLLPLLLLAISVCSAIVQRSGDGVDVNALFETVFALSIATPVGCALRPEGGWRRLGVAALPALVLTPVAAKADVREITGRDAAVTHWAPFIARIAATGGTVACDDQALCYWAGRTSALDFFALKQRLLKGDVPALRAALDRHDFALVAMRTENPGWHENRLIPAIRARYRTIYADDGFELLDPR